MVPVSVFNAMPFRKNIHFNPYNRGKPHLAIAQCRIIILELKIIIYALMICFYDIIYNRLVNMQEYNIDEIKITYQCVIL
jgi:hypothetical protein